jgi:hypothetical protein
MEDLSCMRDGRRTESMSEAGECIVTQYILTLDRRKNDATRALLVALPVLRIYA